MIHPQACIDDDAVIGLGAMVWQFASVIRGARVGEDSNIGSCAIIDGATLGRRCRVGHGASVNPGFLAGDGVFIGPNATIANDNWPWLGGEDFDLGSLLARERFTVIADDSAAIGAGAIILPGVRLGAGSMVAAGATCSRSVPAGHIFHRDGAIVPLRPTVTGLRMRLAS
jgi:UDP-2-acetamido-3-amino-2,3-dideoxy-glucuronate N-acetyltransferase